MKKILIVDDQPEVRELVNVTLRIGNYRIFQADNGAKALEIAKAEKPDLIIMDLMMPGEIDGLEATRILKSDEKTKHCQVVMLTAKGQKTDKEEGYRSGADDYFSKPFSPLELIRKVERTLA